MWASAGLAAAMGEGVSAEQFAAEVVEFWQGRENRIHNRIRVLPGPDQGSADRIERLQP